MNEEGFYAKYFKKEGCKYFCTTCSKSIGDRPFPKKDRKGGIIRHMRRSHNICHKSNNEQVEIAQLREQNASLREQNASLREQNASLREQNASQPDIQVQEKEEDGGNQVKQLESQIAMLQKELSSKDEQLESQIAMLSNKDSELKKLRTRISELQTQRQTQIATFQSLINNIDVHLESML
jgi:chromosome segregation ATPase